ncbi:MAG TPA: PQQ-binding-like beta-propeller repeat protein, partial [Phototrophicaceae bacterium]|nr:PQQ-binding-like beta-propeller repeat protein [Phototrophicaceae bacterium]
WTVEADGVVTGLAALPGNQIVAHTRNGQVLVLDNGRYVAIWTVNGPETPFLVLNQMLVFVTDGGGLTAYDTAGTALWTLPGAGSDRVVSLDTDGAQIAFSVRTEAGILWRVVGLDGQVAVEQRFETFAANAALGSGSWLVLAGGNLEQHTGAETRVLAAVAPPGRAAALTADALGNSYLYLGDTDSTLLAYGPDGTLRWQVTYPVASASLPPLLAVGQGCLLYTLDVDGMLNVFSTADGALVNQLPLYAGGTERTMPAARLLQVDPTTEQIEIATGFLTTLLLDGTRLGSDGGACLLG